MATIIVGVEDSPRSEDAVALARQFALATGAELVAVCAYPFEDRPAAHFNFAMREPLRELSQAVLERLCEPLSDLPHVRRIAVADPAPARALLNAAAGAGAALIVVGSSHAGDHGNVRPGSTGSRLLEGAPCSVALAPQGHRLAPYARHGRIAAAFDGSAQAHAALHAATRVAGSATTPLRVLRVFDPAGPTAPLPGFLRSVVEAEASAREELEQAVEALPGAEAAFLVGDPARELARESQVCDLLICGSRGYGAAPAVLLGEVSGRLVHTAACPVVVVPHGVASPLEGLFAAADAQPATAITA